MSTNTIINGAVNETRARGLLDLAAARMRTDGTSEDRIAWHCAKLRRALEERPLIVLANQMPWATTMGTAARECVQIIGVEATMDMLHQMAANNGECNAASEWEMVAIERICCGDDVVFGTLRGEVTVIEWTAQVDEEEWHSIDIKARSGLTSTIRLPNGTRLGRLKRQPSHYDALRNGEPVMRAVRADVMAEVKGKLAGDITWRPSQS